MAVRGIPHRTRRGTLEAPQRGRHRGGLRGGRPHDRRAAIPPPRQAGERRRRGRQRQRARRRGRGDREGAVEGKAVAVGLATGGRRISKKHSTRIRTVTCVEKKKKESIS